MKKTHNICLEVTVVRHAETDFTEAKPRILQGQNDIDINSTGLEQAKAVAYRLRNEKYDVAYSSDLTRAKSTVKEIMEYHKDTPLIYTRDLREQDIGDLAGLSWTKAKELFTKEETTFEKRLEKCGESTTKFYERIVEFYTFLINKYVIEANNIQTNFHEGLKALSKSNSLCSINELSVSSFGDLSGFDDASSTNSSYNENSFLSNLSNNNSGTFNTLENRNTINKSSSTSSNNNNVLRNKIISNLTTKKFRMFRILLVTHGGFIKNLFKHIMGELKFKVDCDVQNGFPKNTSIYKFSIQHIRIKDEFKSLDDYKWRGKITLMNCVAHLAVLTTNMKKREKILKKEEMERNKEKAKRTSYLLKDICGDIPSDFPGSSSSSKKNVPRSDPDEAMEVDDFPPPPQFQQNDLIFPSSSLGW